MVTESCPVDNSKEQWNRGKSNSIRPIRTTRSSYEGSWCSANWEWCSSSRYGSQSTRDFFAEVRDRPRLAEDKKNRKSKTAKARE